MAVLVHLINAEVGGRDAHPLLVLRAWLFRHRQGQQALRPVLQWSDLCTCTVVLRIREAVSSVGPCLAPACAVAEALPPPAAGQRLPGADRRQVAPGAAEAPAAGTLPIMSAGAVHATVLVAAQGLQAVMAREAGRGALAEPIHTLPMTSALFWAGLRSLQHRDVVEALRELAPAKGEHLPTHKCCSMAFPLFPNARFRRP
mmetsp:Transcript_74724/g.178286  ORF Transcript_74724/g.178286 Transcript_74724/m.178286 type:complete len:201 (+) Transcript_74724:366-968(+)